MDLVVQHAKQVVYGPDTLEHFYEFSFDAVVDELQAHALDLYQLFIQLANTSRTGSDHHGVEELKAVASFFFCFLMRKQKELCRVGKHQHQLVHQ